MSWIRNIGFGALVTIASLALLEFGSFAILKTPSKEGSGGVVEDSFVFEPQSEDGTFRPTGDWVLPMQKGVTYRWEQDEFDVEVRTNSIGLRENFEVNYEDVDVLFFGDSFTFGHGVNVEDRYTNVFALANQKYEPHKIISFSYKMVFNRSTMNSYSEILRRLIQSW